MGAHYLAARAHGERLVAWRLVVHARTGGAARRLSGAAEEARWRERWLGLGLGLALWLRAAAPFVAVARWPLPAAGAIFLLKSDVAEFQLISQSTRRPPPSSHNPPWLLLKTGHGRSTDIGILNDCEASF